MNREHLSIPLNTTIEVCVENIAEAESAERSGADQIEFCSELENDGLTPARSIAEHLCSTLSIPVKIMIRSRAGNFNYHDEEIKEMTNQIHTFLEMPVSGFVIGALDRHMLPDLYAVEAWEQAAGGIPLCFHKAIDLVPDWRKAFDLLSGVPSVKSILTSGLAPTAIDGIATLSAMHQEYGDRFQIIAAGSITPQKVRILSGKWEGKSYHGRRILN